MQTTQGPHIGGRPLEEYRVSSLLSKAVKTIVSEIEAANAHVVLAVNEKLVSFRTNCSLWKSHYGPRFVIVTQKSEAKTKTEACVLSGLSGFTTENSYRFVSFKRK